MAVLKYFFSVVQKNSSGSHGIILQADEAGAERFNLLLNARINGAEQNAVNARELHAFLESKQDFSNWIKNRIEQYGFIQGVDFVQFNNFVESESRARIEYAISISMAKELSMVERNSRPRPPR